MEKIEKDLNAWTVEEFKSLPTKGWREDVGEFDSLIIMPTNQMHGSEFRCMDFVVVKGQTPFYLLSGGSDVIHIDGIGGYGKRGLLGNLPTIFARKGWCIDCLNTSGLLRLFSEGTLTAGNLLSSFDVYSEIKK